MNQTPVSQMQQLVSHWNTIMKPPTSSKKRSREEPAAAMTNSKPKTQNVLHQSSTLPVQSENQSTHGSFAYSFS